jgi:hypothetical protein
MIGGLERYLFSSAKTLSVSGVHSKFPVRFTSLKKGRDFSPLLAMKRPRAAMHPATRCISLRLHRGRISSMALTLSGFASIPRCDTRNPNSLPDGTPKAHLAGLSLMFTFLRLANVSSKSLMKI